MDKILNSPIIDPGLPAKVETKDDLKLLNYDKPKVELGLLNLNWI